MVLLLFGCCVICALVYVVCYCKKPKNCPPGPFWTPYFGNAPEVKKLSIALGGQHLAFEKISKDYNTNVLTLKLGRDIFVVVSGYSLGKEVLTTDLYEGRPDSFFIRLRNLGGRRGITFTDGPYWHTHRNFTMRHMKSLGYGKKSMELQIRAETEDILDHLSDKSIVDLTPILGFSVMNVLWTLVNGKRFDRNNEQLGYFLDLMRKRSKVFDFSGGFLSHFPWLRFVAPEMTGYQMIKNINSKISVFLKEAIEDHYRSWYPGKIDDLIDAYISQMKEEECKTDSTFTEDQLMMVCLDLFIAGSTTTGASLDFLFLIMVLYPEVQEKAVEHINSVLSINEKITYADRLRLPYIEAIILETQRYYTIAPLIGPRRVLGDTILDGYTIPKNAIVLVNVETVHKNVEYWDDPYVFKPERFLDNEGNFVTNEKVITYGLGRRKCLGELIARECIFMFFSSIIRKYKISIPFGNEPPSSKPTPGITQSTQQYSVQLTERIK